MGFARLVQFLLELVRAKYYGTVHIQFRDGKIGIVKTEQTYEVDALPIGDESALAMLKTGRYQVPTV